MKDLPEGIDYSNVIISRQDLDREYEEQKLVLEYSTTFEDPNYEIKLAEYQKEQSNRAVAVKIYRNKLKKYEKWKALPDSEKKKLAKQEKIAALEAQLEKLKK